MVFQAASALALWLTGTMATFLVERYLVGWTSEEVRLLTDRIARNHLVFKQLGVRHVYSMAVTSDEMCLCVFEGPTADAVRHANESAGFPCDRVTHSEVVIS